MIGSNSKVNQRLFLDREERSGVIEVIPHSLAWMNVMD